ncbi:MAG: BCCT family transporter [Pseudomonadota bacterium]
MKADGIVIKVEETGFYQGFNKTIAIVPKILIGALLLWAVVDQQQAAALLAQANEWSTNQFGGWYIWVTAFYLSVCLLLALWPTTGRVKLGRPDEVPEFSRFSWFSMMFGAGIGVGMLTYATAEPIFHFTNNPDTILGATNSLDADNVRNAYKWAFLHYGLTPWGCYGIVGMSMGYFAYNRGMPLTIRTPLQPLLGDRVSSGIVGHMVDIVAILATIIGVAVTIGYGVSQFASGFHNITGQSWLLNADGSPTLAAQLTALIIVLGASTWSAMTGVNKGIKWLSNLNMGLSVFLLLFFVVFGATMFALRTYFYGIWDYVTSLPIMSITVWPDDGSATGSALSDWQAGWTILYWAWWIAFAPFVGLFLARVSRGRTIREYVFGAMVVSSLMCFTWFALAGGTAIDLELRGIAERSIVDADISAQLFKTVNLILSPEFAILMSIVIVILLLTYLVTSADSAILIINTIASAGDQSQKHARHILIWGFIYTAVIGILLSVGGMEALRSAMLVGALPFSLVMALMAIGLIKSIAVDGHR